MYELICHIGDNDSKWAIILDKEKVEPLPKFSASMQEDFGIDNTVESVRFSIAGRLFSDFYLPVILTKSYEEVFRIRLVLEDEILRIMEF